MKTVAIIQARMGSSRLRGKIMAEIAGDPMLMHVIRRTEYSEKIDMIAIATSLSADDDTVEEFCIKKNISFFRGSLNDVLDRYYQAAQYFGADIVVRLTADCPLLDPKIIDKVIDTFVRGSYDYVSNCRLAATYPDGLDTEVFWFKVLKNAWQNATLKSEREHVTPFIYNHPELFSLGNVRNAVDLSSHRWTVDELQDLEFVKKIYEYFKNRPFGMHDILDLLNSNPNLLSINNMITRDEGYKISLNED